MSVEKRRLPRTRRRARAVGSGTPPERLTDEAVQKLKAPVPGAGRSTCSTRATGSWRRGARVVPQRWRRHWACEAGVRHGAPARPRRGNRSAPAAASRSLRRSHEAAAMPTVDHLSYGLVLGRVGGRPVRPPRPRSWRARGSACSGGGKRLRRLLTDRPDRVRTRPVRAFPQADRTRDHDFTGTPAASTSGRRTTPTFARTLRRAPHGARVSGHSASCGYEVEGRS
ncbi:hypothetical protein FHR84_003456 [Actinopolyspora biskrensis]|uniref:Uncharacterized protein n=1 Tax=Actinopolyspora biskrensis TaxID=1470178 RepID=A0A852ZBT7_9ACTN|nr:hypothetical protein [Actinopolyspora biskrensis]